MNAFQMEIDFGELPSGRFDRESKAFVATRLIESPTGNIRLMESVCERKNMRKALRRVEKNKGAPGIDGMKTSELRGYIKRHWPTIKATLLAGTYVPKPVLRREIEKPDGGVRLLGIPTVLDRMIQQAMAQVLQEIWDHTFSDNSYGFRPQRSQHMAIQQAKCYVEEGYTYVVDIDLAKFFDRVNHDRLMSRLATRVPDKRVLKLVRRFLNSGVMVGGLTEPTREGTPQGGPLSPLMSNIVLDELDKELEKRGLHFVRYADDCVIYVKSERAGDRVMQSVSRFITRKLKLQVNEDKSSVTRPWQSRYLGFRLSKFFGATRIHVHAKSLRRFRDQVRAITARKRGRSIGQIVRELNEYVGGWWNYYHLGANKGLLRELNNWMLRRLRAYRWSQWKLPRTRVRALLAAGVPLKWARMAGNTRKGPWRMSKINSVRQTLPDKYFTAQLGLVLLG